MTFGRISTGIKNHKRKVRQNKNNQLFEIFSNSKANATNVNKDQTKIMDLGLTRVDLLQVGLTYPKSAKLLPNVSPGEKAQQKVNCSYFNFFF